MLNDGADTIQTWTTKRAATGPNIADQFILRTARSRYARMLTLLRRLRRNIMMRPDERSINTPQLFDWGAKGLHSMHTPFLGARPSQGVRRQQPLSGATPAAALCSALGLNEASHRLHLARDLRLCRAQNAGDSRVTYSRRTHMLKGRAILGVPRRTSVRSAAISDATR